MSLKVKDIDRIIEQYAPSKFKEDYDNVGLMVGDMECEVTSILVALDCTLDVINEAKEKECNFILTHHPLIFKKPMNITKDTLLGKKIIELIKNDINVYSSHTNLDSIKGGVNDTIMQLLNFHDYNTIELSKRRSEDDKVSGIGRIAALKEAITLDEMCSRVKKCLNAPFIRYAGNENKKIKKVAVINGSGQSYFNEAKKLGADCIITGDTTYHYVSDFKEENIAVIDAGHFDTEWPAVLVLAEYFKNQIELKGYKNSVFMSESNKNPYKCK
ncbi:Nif3-like dinuclear metal center hexameric protein [Clostridium sp. P21]|uniref:GTP cyclohydrolase 1 type 2 homolog n=1 Tax=Clostridium muellerianum TaxID=2716538 RepID=A0A7Y0HNS0_9CLOT|nr:Nif3-like dinuclear metal center hexameric protein [Clostridium muellerianum]NMM61923.1 Nif3-like dinuclear metal center hexameric protein [Clostridium muellerianum]